MVAGRALLGLALLCTTACGATVESVKSGGDYVPWAPLPAAHQYVDPAAATLAPPAVPPGTPECVGGQLEGVGLAGGAAAGNSNTPLLLRNKGIAGCYLRGFVDVAVVDRRGRV